jgi:hypothetical protein
MIVCLTILMLFGAKFLLPTDGTARTAADLSVVLFGFVVVWIWLHGNEAALARVDRSEGQALPIGVAEPAVHATSRARGAACSPVAAIDQTSSLPPHAETLRRS